MTRISPKTIVMAFVVLVAVAVFVLMAFTPTDNSGHGSMSGHDMGSMSGMQMDDHVMTGH